MLASFSSPHSRNTYQHSLPPLPPHFDERVAPRWVMPVQQAPWSPRVTTLRNVIVTACSPNDPKDVAYYAKHGYKGSTYNVAADYRQLPKGTMIRIGGYRGGRWHIVDSPGGSIIRRSTRRGDTQVDVKFATLYSVKEWGRKVMTIEVIYPKDQCERTKALIGK